MKKKKEPKFKIAWIINSEDIHCISLILKHQNSSRYNVHLSSPSDPFSDQKCKKHNVGKATFPYTG